MEPPGYSWVLVKVFFCTVWCSAILANKLENRWIQKALIFFGENLTSALWGFYCSRWSLICFLKQAGCWSMLIGEVGLRGTENWVLNDPVLDRAHFVHPIFCCTVHSELVLRLARKRDEQASLLLLAKAATRHTVQGQKVLDTTAQCGK